MYFYILLCFEIAFMIDRQNFLFFLAMLKTLL